LCQGRSSCSGEEIARSTRKSREKVEKAQLLWIGENLRIGGRRDRIAAFERIIEHIAHDDRARLTTRRAIAEHFVRAAPAPA
jgi:hypothetical protein